jgi:hypothetical protein
VCAEVVKPLAALVDQGIECGDLVPRCEQVFAGDAAEVAESARYEHALRHVRLLVSVLKVVMGVAIGAPRFAEV